MSTLNVDTIKSANQTYEYGKCLAWVDFDASGTPTVVNALNVSSITDTATGRFTVNFTNNLPNANYVLAGSAGNNTTTTAPRSINKDAAWTVSGAAIRVCGLASATYDDAYVGVVFFGNL